MKAHGKADISRKTNTGVEVVFSEKTRDAIRPFLVSYTTKDNPPVIDLSINVECTIETTARGGIVSFQFLNMPDVWIESVYSKQVKAQMSTLRGIERFIFWATEGCKSRGDKDIYYIHEALIEQFSKEVVNPMTKKSSMMRTGDPNMDVVTMSRMIEGAMNWLATLDIPQEVLNSIGRPMKELWDEWYKWRYENENGDPLFDEEQTYSWTDYKLVHPVCEICGLPSAPGDPLERMHIVSAGADKTVYEFPWNWLHAHHSHHVEQHGTAEGWNKILYEYPVIKGKIQRARKCWDEHRRNKNISN